MSSLFNNNFTNETQKLERTEDVMDYEYFLGNILGFSFLIALCVFGTIGNILTFIIYYGYYRKTNYRVFVLVLAIVDLAACVVVIPLKIARVRFNYSLSTEILCKIGAKFLSFGVTFAAAFLLVFIAIERYSKVCRHDRRQFKRKEVVIICIVVIVFSIMFAGPTILFYGAKRPTDTNVNIRVCAVSSEYQDTPGLQVYSALQYLLAITAILACIVIYSLIAKRVYFMMSRLKLHKKPVRSDPDINMLREMEMSEGEGTLPRKSKSKTRTANVLPTPVNRQLNGHVRSTLAVSNSYSMDSSETEGTLQKPEHSSFVADDMTTSGNGNVKQKNVKKNKLALSSYNRTLRVTFMFLTYTILSYIACVIGLVFASLESHMGGSESAIIIFGQSYLVLSNFHLLTFVITPIVYGFVDKKFRKNLKDLLTCIMMMKKEEKRKIDCNVKIRNYDNVTQKVGLY